MSKLLNDPKIAALVEKSAAAAAKAENKRVLAIVKDQLTGAKALEDKVVKSTVTGILKDITIEMKMAA